MSSKYGISKILINIYSLNFSIYTKFNLLFPTCKLILNNNYIIPFSFPILLSGTARKIGSIINFTLNNFIYIIISIVNINNSKIIIVKFIIIIIIIIIIATVTTPFFINL